MKKRRHTYDRRSDNTVKIDEMPKPCQPLYGIPYSGDTSHIHAAQEMKKPLAVFATASIAERDFDCI
jgi:hypothetical protein